MQSESLELPEGIPGLSPHLPAEPPQQDGTGISGCFHTSAGGVNTLPQCAHPCLNLRLQGVFLESEISGCHLTHSHVLRRRTPSKEALSKFKLPQQMPGSGLAMGSGFTKVTLSLLVKWIPSTNIFSQFQNGQ